MTGSIVIVGCGPAGLLSAWAAEQHGLHPIILGGKEPTKSVIQGAQYLHSAIPGLTSPEEAFTVRYKKVGNAKQYVHKVYQKNIPTSLSSWWKFSMEHEAYPLHEVYDRLWEHFKGGIQATAFNASMAPAYKKMTGRNVICSAPLPSIVNTEFDFQTETVVVVSGECEEDVGYNEIVYYGDTEHRAYRSSNILGHKSIEYPGHEILTGGVYVTKPLRAVGTRPDGVDLVGRYGRWRKGVLVDDAYTETVEYIKRA